ncbi:MAG: hypothetical protein HKN25_18125 [Pyrinomonadaceae bacterium]|nr:hypothetical protein [Pyrinomonadaceae bacterium]
MKIYSTEPNGNEAADLEHALYMNMAIDKIKEESARLKGVDTPIQIMLAHIDILLHLSKKFEQDAELLILSEDVNDWRETFGNWFERAEKKIPAKFRTGIKASADSLFAELDEIAS